MKGLEQMKNIIFMDVDGTLCGQDGAVPISAREAIVETRSKGNLVYLCTGRSLPEINEEILSIGFDGIIGAGGGYIENKTEILFHQMMEKEDVLLAVEYFRHHDMGYYLESNDALFASDNCISKIREAVYQVVKDYPRYFRDENPEPQWFYDVLNDNLHKEVNLSEINKICFIDPKHPFEKAESYFKEKFRVHHATVFEFGMNSGELGILNINKFTAIQKLLKTLDIENCKTYAFGDGLNDIDMFKAVDYSVAMENGKPGLKKYAHKITDIAEEDGIYKSFQELGLI